MKVFIIFAACIAITLALPQDPTADQEGVGLVGCDDDAICGADKKCLAVNLGIRLNRQEPFKGACVPLKCNEKGECPTQGKPISGILSGRCLKDGVTCEYFPHIAIA